MNFDLAASPLRELNQRLHDLAGETTPERIVVRNPRGA
ncbi:MAG: hypothetical protein QOJ47_609, partial [Gaiellales bacterium]|nr:hypothetical protein [Gaiellales bacterium]